MGNAGDKPAISRWRDRATAGEFDAARLTHDNLAEVQDWVEARGIHYGADGNVDGLIVYTGKRSIASFGDWVIPGGPESFPAVVKDSDFRNWFEPAAESAGAQ